MMKILRKILFLIQSKNRHGVHSPFVYQLNDICFNDTKHYEAYSQLENLYPTLYPLMNKKRIRLFYRLMTYFKAQNYALAKQSLSSENTYDILVIDPREPISFEKIKELTHSKSVIIVQDIHDKNQDLWQKFIQSEDFRVTIDTYEQGLVFYRKEQVKEHFRIRV